MSVTYPLPTVITDFTADLVVIRGSSQKTAENYSRDLAQFFRYLKAKREKREELIAAPCPEFDQIDVSDCDLEFVRAVTPTEVLGYLYFTQNVLGNAPRSRSRKLSSLRTFYKFYCQRRHLIEVNPTADLDNPRLRPALPKFLTLEESLRLLDTVASDTASKSRRRDYCIVTLLLNCGMRLSELCGINISDIDSEFRSLRVLGKGAKERIVYLNDACRTALGDYMTERLQMQSVKPEARDALLISSRYTRLSHQMVQVMVEKYLTAAGLGNRGLSVHKLRHTAATLMYQNGVDVRVLKDVLGHEQLNTTQIYTHISDRQMEEAMDRNPLSARRRRLPKAEEPEKPTDDGDGEES